jgi:hypothetical protein
MRFGAAELEGSLGNDHPQGKGTARQALAVGAGARIYQPRHFAGQAD